MYRNIHNLLRSEYEKRQKESFDSLMERRKEVYSKVPRIEEIDKEIHLIGIKYNKMILLGTTSSQIAEFELLKASKLLRDEKEHLLEEHSYPTDYLESEFKCEKCKDTGFVEGSSGTLRCTCYSQQYINYLFNQSNLRLALLENFSNFDESYYPECVNEALYGVKISPRKNILRIRDRAMSFIDNIDKPDEKNLYFCGPTGVGKTFMVNCIAAELLNRERTVLYQTAPSLYNTINEYRLKSYKDEAYEDMSYYNLFNVDLLIIDDLGTESPTAARYAELLNILNMRQENNLSRACKTIISTNLSVARLSEFYDERVASRIIGGFDLFRFAGEDIRMFKKKAE
ncbi:MAG: ATP-binding protein [Clostridiaceae bacterium]|nr:ATP-binding protein [Clostridiaceae bacterium]